MINPIAPQKLDLDAILQIARLQLSDQPAADSLQKTTAFEAIFNQAAGALSNAASVNIFVFHAEVPASASAINYRDVTIDHSKFDYNRIVEHCIKAGLAAQPGARVILVTDDQFGRNFAHPALVTVRLPLDTASPMYQRVVAMYAYVRSALFTVPTVFLDGDAFLNDRVDRVFKANFDVAVTYRHQAGLMPINEGVLFANPANKTGVGNFFRFYLGTYDCLCRHPIIRDYYGDIKRWRGGQLSLNALACPLGLPSELDQANLQGARITYYACDTFNFSMEGGQNYQKHELDSKVVLHLKGRRKVLLDAIAEYQQQRHRALEKLSLSQSIADTTVRDQSVRPTAQVPTSLADRIYSLDTTTPADYEPPAVINYAQASLTEIADHFKTDKGTIKHHYTRHYETYFSPLRQRPGVSLMEIGVACGSSLKMWSKYFVNAQVTGVDIREECKQLCKRYPNISIYIADASKKAIDGQFDIIIDDGSHVSRDIVDTFRLNWPNLKPSGIYVIEDLKCTHNPAYRSLLPFDIPEERFNRHHFTAMIDDCLKQMDWRQSDIEFIHFYRELAFIKKAAA
ncbi:SAM-dependent methyltransferase [Dongia soli]|uniref:Methyltransferase family protein n=1 Tax=Dongia soli TaxID=600628 RepID=A0ABU5E9C7_9PROT|nr:class I SAM-dependent methyltransferase [Dongia soli]MDY0882649.1 hypothetical protein [Dongia soli]